MCLCARFLTKSEAQNGKKKFFTFSLKMTFSALISNNNNFRPLLIAPRCGEDSTSNNRRRRRSQVDVTSSGGESKRRDFLLLSSSSSFIAATLFDSSRFAKAAALTEEGGGGGNNDEFQSPLVKALLKQTEENKSLRKLQLETKYCLRQSQLGVGDCADIDEETILKIQRERAEKLKTKEKEGKERETND